MRLLLQVVCIYLSQILVHNIGRTSNYLFCRVYCLQRIVCLSLDFKVCFRFIFSPDDYIFLGKVDAFPPALTSHIPPFYILILLDACHQYQIVLIPIFPAIAAFTVGTDSYAP